MFTFSEYGITIIFYNYIMKGNNKMKVAVSSSGKDLNAQLDPRFGRCAFFMIVETDDMSFEAFDNESMSLGGGAGIQSAQFVASKGAKAVITGNCGPNAVQTLSAAGIELFTGQSGTVKEAVEIYIKGNLTPTEEANVENHFGMGEKPMPAPAASASGAGMGGGGRGMGGGGRCMGGGGRGMGRGMGMSGMGMPGQAGSGQLPKTQDLKSLKEQAGTLSKQMEEIMAQIKKLEQRD